MVDTMKEKLEDKVILVTGASSGIGRATCVELAARGAEVVLLGRNVEGLRETARRLPDGKFLIVRADLADFTQIAKALDEIFAWRLRVHGMVYCAGLGLRARLRDTGMHDYERLMRVNCFAFIELARLLAKSKKKQDILQIATISSLAALGHHKYLTAYAASKAALEAAAKCMAVELMGRNTRINIIRCAFVNTPMGYDPDDQDEIWDSAAKMKENGQQPLGIIPPAEIAKMAAFLVGPDALYSTGCVFTINAGATN